MTQVLTVSDYSPLGVPLEVKLKVHVLALCGGGPRSEHYSNREPLGVRWHWTLTNLEELSFLVVFAFPKADGQEIKKSHDLQQVILLVAMTSPSKKGLDWSSCSFTR